MTREGLSRSARLRADRRLLWHWHMKLGNPLALVLGGQMVVLLGAGVVFAVQQSQAATPHVKKKAKAVPAAREEKEAPHLGEQEVVAAAPAHGEQEAPHEEAPAAPQEHEASSFEKMVESLVAGNARFAEGVSRQRDSVAVRVQGADQEHADAVVVTCTDSRIVPELIFDAPIGSFVVVRTSGGQVDVSTAKTVEESVKRLGAHTVLVMGHAGCHHAEASVAKALKGKPVNDGATVSVAVKDLRKKSPWLAKGHEVTIFRLLYTPKTGVVTWLDADDSPPPTAEAHVEAKQHGS